MLALNGDKFKIVALILGQIITDALETGFKGKKLKEDVQIMPAIKDQIGLM